MKIMHVSKKYPDSLGGDAIVVANLEKQQRKMEHDVTILTSNCPDVISSPYVHTFGLSDTAEALDGIGPKRLISLVMLLFKSFWLFWKIRPDVIHTHSVDMAFIVSFPARLFNIRRVHTFHVVTFNDPRQQGIRSKVELFLAKGADLDVITVLDPQLVKDLEAEGFKKVVYVPNGVDTDFWKPAKKKQKNDVFTFIAVGRLEEQKGFTYLVDAAAELKKTNDKFLVNIVGDGSLKASLQNQIDRLKLRKNVKLLGRKKPDEVLKLYQTSDAFILSSLWEGMPLTLLEALAVNMPLITVDLSTTKNIVGEEYIGLVKIGDANSLFKSMHRMISDSRISKMVALQSTEIIKHYEWGSVSGEYINIYTSEITS